MRLTGLRVDGYGILHDLTLTGNDLRGAPVVIYGPNEAGKSTLLSFIRGVLFGFKAEGAKPGPVRGGQPGGWLLLEDNGEVFRVQRTGKGDGRVVVELPDGAKKGEAFLRHRLLRGVSSTFFKNVFAVGIDELRKIDDLRREEVSSYIYGAGTGVKPERLAQAAGALNSSLLSLFNPDRRAQKPEINKILSELDQLGRRIRQLEQQPAQYRQLQAEQAALTQRQALLLAERRQLQDRGRRLENLRKARPPWLRRQNLEARLAEEKAGLSEAGGKFPGGPAAGEKPFPLNERLAALEQLDRDWQRREALEVNREGQQNRFDDLRLRKEFVEGSLQSAASRKEPVWMSAIALVLGFAGLLIAGPGAAGFSILAGCTGLAVLNYFVFRSMAAGNAARREQLRREAQTITQEMGRVQANLERLDGERQEITRRIEKTACRLGLKENFTGEDLSLLRHRLEKEKKVQSIQQEIAAVEEQLLLLAGSSGELVEMERVLAVSSEGEIEAEWEQVRDRLAVVEEEINRLKDELAEKKLRLEQMESGEELAVARQMKSMLEEALRAKAREWRVRALCAALLALAREKHERERQPAVLGQASRYLQPMTDGRYVRVVTPLGAPDRLEVEQPDGRRVDAAFLSRGAAHQLYFALRLALAGHHSRATAPLPVILDDLMVDFDPRRLRGAVRVLGEIAAGQQVLFFTCHRHIREVIEELLPDSRCVTLTTAPGSSPPR